jgi:predicted RNA-binding protein with TRAM domain
MLTSGETHIVTIEKPAVGGRMIARVNGQIVLVSGAIPGERSGFSSIASVRAWLTAIR